MNTVVTHTPRQWLLASLVNDGSVGHVGIYGERTPTQDLARTHWAVLAGPGTYEEMQAAFDRLPEWLRSLSRNRGVGGNPRVV